MDDQFENPEEVKVEDETDPGETAKERIERVADKAARKPSETVQNYDNEHTIISH